MKPFIVFAEYRDGFWHSPDRWRVGRWVGETSKMWTGHIIEFRDGQSREFPARRRALDLIKGRFATLDEALAAIREARRLEREIEARAGAVKDEMTEVMAPFKSRIAQIQSERDDRLREIMKGKDQ